MRARRPLTADQEQKAEARRERFRALAQQIGAMSDEQRAAMAARMAAVVTVEGHVLTVHNACLVACQRPDATVLGGYQQWLRAGRQVRKGESGLMIWAPIKGRREDHAEPTASSIGQDRPRFVMVTVFDVGQTDMIAEGAA